MFLTYLQVTAYLVVSTFVAGQINPVISQRGPLEWLAVVFDAGNIRVALQELDQASSGPGGVSAALPAVVGGYAAFHGLISVVALIGATAPLRRWVRLQASRGNRRSFVLALTQRRLPRVSNRPMIWKEVFAEPTFRFNRTGMVLTATFLSVCLILGFFIESCLFAFGLSFGEMDRYMNQGARTLGTFFACLLLVGVAIRAAGSFSSERDRQTLVSLLGTPLEGHEILWAKWLGAILSGRKVWWYLAGIWLAALFTAGLHPLALPLLIITWTGYAMFLASLGVWFSLVSRTTLRATIWTMLTMLGTCVVPWLLSAFWLFVMEFLFAPPQFSRPMGPWARPPSVQNSVYGWGEALPDLLSALAPPSTLHFLTFYHHDFDPLPYYRDYYDRYGYQAHAVSPWARLLAIVFALVCYVLAAIVLYTLACARFSEVTGRMPLARGSPGKKAARRSA
jgi:hypothetical protein